MSNCYLPPSKHEDFTIFERPALSVTSERLRLLRRISVKKNAIYKQCGTIVYVNDFKWCVIIVAWKWTALSTLRHHFRKCNIISENHSDTIMDGIHLYESLVFNVSAFVRNVQTFEYPCLSNIPFHSNEVPTI